MAKTRAQENRAIRQEALREQLAKQKHVEKVLDCIDRLNEPPPVLKEGEQATETPAERTQRLKVVIDSRLKLVDKYLPSLKAVEHEGAGGGDLVVEVTRRIVRPS